MLKQISTAIPASVGSEPTQTEKAAAQVIAQSVFRVLHGYYGALFMSKFSTGELNEQKIDTGLLSARRVWANSLGRFDRSAVASALETCKQAHPEFPPSLPQFEALCRAATPRATFPTEPTLPMAQSLRSEYTKRARAKVAAQLADMAGRDEQQPMSLDGMKRLVAQAVGLAGGDEGATLLRLDRELAPRAAA